MMLRETLLRRRQAACAIAAIACCLLTLFPSPAAAESWKERLRAALKNGGAYVEDDQGQEVFSHRADEYFVPASILKVATVAAAFHILGDDFRPVTDFFITPDGRLAVKGYGDPYLVSEELAFIAKRLAAEAREIEGLLLDDSYFAPGIVIDGVGGSTNPYDAVNGALLANFNTVHVTKSKKGAVSSAEPQTPLTPTAIAAARRLPAGTIRANLGADRTAGVRYFGELLQHFLRQEGVTVAGTITPGPVPADGRLVYRHTSSKSLAETSRSLLDYSTNFLANQLFLLIGAKAYGAPATVEKGQRALGAFLREQVGWEDFTVAEGAGLSRRNQVTPRQMVILLRYFLPLRHLLSDDHPPFKAKTGSLTGVSTLAGYLPGTRRREVRFALMVNDKVAMSYRFQVAELLRKGLAP